MIFLCDAIGVLSSSLSLSSLSLSSLSLSLSFCGNNTRTVVDFAAVVDFDDDDQRTLDVNGAFLLARTTISSLGAARKLVDAVADVVVDCGARKLVDAVVVDVIEFFFFVFAVDEFLRVASALSGVAGAPINIVLQKFNLRTTRRIHTQKKTFEMLYFS